MRPFDKKRKPKFKLHYFPVEVAKQYGVNEAIVLYHLIYWISKNSMKKRNNIDGRTWTYNSVRNFKKYLVYWSEPKIRRILKTLEEKDVIISDNHNKHKYDKTKWYALNDEEHWLTKYNPVDRNEEWDIN